MGKNCKNTSTELERNWPEDYPHENGCYQNKCSICGSIFLGMKRRPVCKVCYNASTPDITPDLCCGITDSVVSQGEMFEKVEVEDFRKLVSALWLYAMNNAWWSMTVEELRELKEKYEPTIK